MSAHTPCPRKRLLICCDGTWQNSDSGFNRTSICNPVGTLQVASNVTRISRAFKRQCPDGTVQIIEYHAGVGSSGTLADFVTGGTLGVGVSEAIREVYAFICANYADGDDIVLIGFSRGAYTARSVAGMIGHLGLLTREGMEFFYPIFKDMQNWRAKAYKDPFPGLPFADKPVGEHAADQYRAMLIERGLSRAHQQGGQGRRIKVKAVAVWDTVGRLGVPRVSWRGLGPSKKVGFYDTSLSEHIEHAFQALALDEHRDPFSPSVWERTAANGQATELRQCWFPGNHGNCGGGWLDAGIANLSLAWMMDQLGSIGVEFDEATVPRLAAGLERYYGYAAAKTGQARPEASEGSTATPWGAMISDADPDPNAATGRRADPDPIAATGRRDKGRGARKPPPPPPWAIEPIFHDNFPVRPWGLGALLSPPGLVYKLAGSSTRTPGLYKKADPTTGRPTRAFLEDTNERVHSSVRVRLALAGLGLNDKGVWDAPALRGRWRLRRTTTAEQDDASGQHGGWVWEYCGPEGAAPPRRVMVEEALGRYERELVGLTGGTPNVYDFAAGVAVAL